MFGSDQSYEPLHTGKKILGPQSRKQPQFSLGWDNTNQMNSYQAKKSKNNEITGKVGAQGISENKPTTGSNYSNQGYQGSHVGNQQERQPAVLKPVNSSKVENSPYEVNSMRDYKLLEYERLLREYPDIPAEEIQKIVMGMDFEERNNIPPTNPPSQNYDRANNYSSSSRKQKQVQPIRREEPMSSQKRTAVRPKESMKDIIYGGGEIGSQNQNPQKVSFRRNNTNLILGDGYNYFKNPY